MKISPNALVKSLVITVHCVYTLTCKPNLGKLFGPRRLLWNCVFVPGQSLSMVDVTPTIYFVTMIFEVELFCSKMLV